jgi:hypothetical protein
LDLEAFPQTEQTTAATRKLQQAGSEYLLGLRESRKLKNVIQIRREADACSWRARIVLGLLSWLDPATGPRLTDKTLFTEFGALVGTLEYLSPEQAELNNQDIDSRGNH